MKKLFLLVSILATISTTAFAKSLSTISTAINQIMETKQVKELSTDAFLDVDSNIKTVADLIDQYSVALIASAMNENDFYFYCEEAKCTLNLTVESVVNVIDFDESGNRNDYKELARTSIKAIANYEDSSLRKLTNINLEISSDSPNFAASIEDNSIKFKARGDW